MSTVTPSPGLSSGTARSPASPSMNLWSDSSSSRSGFGFLSNSITGSFSMYCGLAVKGAAGRVAT